ncbi:MAG: GNAT family N-acetyltransferase [Candidatus Krumholzibacteria bacterium]|nr:GNAT family N-acetyltransferase [Candidatus Krumholzibacteria bacterium]
MLKLVNARSEKDILDVKELFQEYADSLDFSLYFQDFEEELVGLLADYAPPGGTIVLAVFTGENAGCVALRRIDEKTCEMKRLYVRPQYRRKGIGRRLAEAVIEYARRVGYMSMRLDTISSMKQANSLYRSLGFREIEPYRYNPLESAIYMELKLK